MKLPSLTTINDVFSIETTDLDQFHSKIDLVLIQNITSYNFIDY